MKPMLAEDVVSFETLRYPLYGSFKIDGVRAIMPPGMGLVPRSLKTFGNKHLTGWFNANRHILQGMDGELTLGSNPAIPNLCRFTTSATSSHDGEPDIHWWIFDKLPVGGQEPFSKRVAELKKIFKDRTPAAWSRMRVHLVEQRLIRNAAEAEAFEHEALARGYEGIVLKSPDGAYKYGRSTLKEQAFLRVKRFADAEGEILRVTERQKNNNEVTINELGHTTRSSHKANKAGSGTLGTITIKVFNGPFKGVEVDVGTGWDADTAQDLWNRRDALPGRLIKFSYFPIGCKDKPRFPVFQGFRSSVDL
jgi:DNA ligase-1